MLTFAILIPAALLAADVGSISFPVTGTPETRACFERGVAMMHNFWFEEAREQFQQCAKAAPQFAMGYWGEAMTYNHSLWMRVWPEDGRAALDKIKDESKLTARERAFIAAARTLFSKTGDKLQREKAYSAAMEKIYLENPGDFEAATFYALSLLGQVRPGDAGYARQAKAGAIALDVYSKNSNHPGAAHYIIHAFDDPDHAIIALPAARRYAEIAPEAHHARHMPSHIFLQLGMWDDVVKSNESSWAASVAWQKRKGHALAVRDYHSQFWMAYGYLQQGRYGDAWKVYEQKKADIIEAQGAGAVYNYYPDLAAAIIFETGEWDKARTAFDDPVTIRRNSTEEHAHAPAPSRRASEAFTKGMAAALSGESPAAWLDLLEQARQIEDQKGAKVTAAVFEARMLMIKAAQAQRAKQTNEMIALMQRATQLEEMDKAPSGPPEITKPSHELFGEMLLDAGRPKEAAVQFRKSLDRQRNRTRSVKGLARALATGGVESGQ